MPKYKIVKESKALPHGSEVGDVINGRTIQQTIENRCRVPLLGINIENGHLNTLMELGVVEDVKEWNLRELKERDPLARQIEEVHEKYRGFLNAPNCPECDGSGGVQVNEDECHECHWCHVKKTLIATLLTEARKKWLEEQMVYLKSIVQMRLKLNYAATDSYRVAFEDQISRLQSELSSLDAQQITK